MNQRQLLNLSKDDIMDYEKSGRKREEPLLKELSSKRAKERAHYRTASTSDPNEVKKFQHV